MKSVYEFRALTAADIPLLLIATAQGVDLQPLAGAHRFLGWGPTKHGHAPICVIDIASETPYVVEPHVAWLPWASKRQKYGGFKWFLQQWEKVVFLIVLKDQSEFYEQFVERGLLKKVGALEVPKEAGEEIRMYQKVAA